MTKHAPTKAALQSVARPALVVLVGWLLWFIPLGDFWVNASFDYQLRFGSRSPTNKVALILMDNAAFDSFQQTRGQPWDRALHAKLLNRLADDGCAMVVLDSFFRDPSDPHTDEALATALRRQRSAVLMAEQSEITHPGVTGLSPVLPYEVFLQAARTNWGVAWLAPDLDSLVRHHWPFPSPGLHPSLPWTAARVTGASLNPESRERWLRYYGPDGPGLRMSYGFALAQPPGYFRDFVVFIGNEPKTSWPDAEPDEFGTPYTRWTGESSGGVHILCTQFLNLLNDESLLRPSWVMEFILLTFSGLLLSLGLRRVHVRTGLLAAVAIFIAVPLLAALLSHFSNFWFPWFIITGAQLPCAVMLIAAERIRARRHLPQAAPEEILPDTPGYTLVRPAFGQGAYGKVWLARNKQGQWRALKAIYLSKFENSRDPYDREFSGIQKYMLLSKQHPGLLQVDYVSAKGADSFYYVMELGDSVVPGWERDIRRYKPCDLDNWRAQFPGNRLPLRECVRIGISLCETLEFIHGQGMTHRDIKPQNILFVGGQPKLADLGLITHVRKAGEPGTLVGTPGYIPPPPDRPGTISADIYALGIALYVLSSGKSPVSFPVIATTLANANESELFLGLNFVILKACEPLPEARYASAGEMLVALRDIQGLKDYSC